MATIHATAKKVTGGYVPAFMVRGSDGKLRGCIVPKGAEREYRLFTSKAAAVMDAHAVAFAVARDNPEYRIA
jgi:hypothetical protein